MAVKLDPKGNAVLVRFPHGSGRVDALIFRGDGEQPFVYAFDYDEETGEWSQGRYYGDPAWAYFAASPEIIESSVVYWQLQDYRLHLLHEGIDPTDENVQKVNLEAFGMRIWRDRVTEQGNDTIAEAVADAFGREES